MHKLVEYDWKYANRRLFQEWIFRLENAINSASCHFNMTQRSFALNQLIRNKEFNELNQTPDFAHVSFSLFVQSLGNGQRD